MNRNTAWAFLEGLTERSWISLACAIAVAVGLLWGGMKFVDEQFFVAHAPFFQTSEDPRTTEVAKQILSLGIRPEETLCVVVGDDSRPALQQFWEEWSERGSPVPLLDFRYSGQTLWESVALIDLIPAGTLGVVVLDLSEPRLQPTIAELRQCIRAPRLPIRSRALDKEILIAQLPCPALSGNFFWDNQAYFIRHFPRAVAHAFFGRFRSTTTPPNDPSTRTFADDNLIVPPMLDSILRRLTDNIKRRTRMDCLIISQPWNANPQSPANENAGELDIQKDSGRVTWLNPSTVDTDASTIVNAVAVRLARTSPTENKVVP